VNLAARVHFIDQALDMPRVCGDDPDGGGNTIHARLPLERIVHGFLDERGGIPGRAGASLGKVAHLIGHYREAQAGLAGARRFHGCVQRQNIRLKGDLIDGFGKPLSLAPTFPSVFHAIFP
jgi:hypothetical protein